MLNRHMSTVTEKLTQVTTKNRLWKENLSEYPFNLVSEPFRDVSPSYQSHVRSLGL